MHINACKEFYVNLTLYHYKKKEVARLRVRGVEIKFDSMRLASILGIPGNNGICEYIKEVWEESKYTMPLEITRKFANDELINVARRVWSFEMKPFQRFVHFMVMKNLVPRFGKRETTGFMDLTYMDHLVTRRLVNLPRVMMRHMSYAISVKDHELPYGDWHTMVFEAFDVPMIDKQGEEPKRYDFFEETFLAMSEAPAVPVFPASPRDSTNVQKEPATAGFDPTIPSGSILDSVILKLQAELEQARARRLQADLEKAQADNV
ncbi:hypothetical protein Dimus_029238 [Dionaea muscipula]